MKKLNFLQNKHIHFVGIGGISMSGLAKLVISAGGIVSGSDISSSIEVKQLIGLGATISIGHDADNVRPDHDLIVCSSAISYDNVELVRARMLNIRIMERSEFLGCIASCYDKVIAVSGTHGKTTTTAIISEILTIAGLNPTIHLGGESIGLKGNTIIGGNEYFVVEACEYKESFRYLNPYIGIITNIEFDHPDYYKSFDDIHDAFTRFADNSGCVITTESTNIVHGDKVTIDSDWKVKNIQCVCNGYSFNVYYRGEFYHSFRINMLGQHNITNSLFAIATAHRLGIDRETIESALAGFQGVERRYECIHTYETGCRVIIDYAHHPTELRTSIEGLRDVYKRTLYIFQPHTYTRTKALFGDFVEVLKDLPNIIMYPTYPAREQEIVGGRAIDIYTALPQKSKYYIDNIHSLLSTMRSFSTTFDCVLVLGAGSLAEKLKSSLY